MVRQHDGAGTTVLVVIIRFVVGGLVGWKTVNGRQHIV